MTPHAELQIDVFDSDVAAMEWMRNSDFDVNPVGIVFDADELLQRFKAGAPREELVARRPLREGESAFDHLR